MNIPVYLWHLKGKSQKIMEKLDDFQDTQKPLRFRGHKNHRKMDSKFNKINKRTEE